MIVSVQKKMKNSRRKIKANSQRIKIMRGLTKEQQKI
jgi:hypothetical protein